MYQRLIYQLYHINTLYSNIRLFPPISNSSDSSLKPNHNIRAVPTYMITPALIYGLSEEYRFPQWRARDTTRNITSDKI